MIKLVHFIHGLNTGGAETLVKNYAMLLDKTQFDLTILCHERYDSPYESILAAAGIPVIYVCDEIKTWGKKDLFSRGRNCIELYIRTRRHLRQLNPDIIHYHLILSSYLRFAHIPSHSSVLLTVHSDPRRLWLNGNKDRTHDYQCTNWLLRHYNMHLIALHEDMRRELMEMFHTDKVFRLNNGINLEAYHKTIEVATKRQKLGIPEAAFVVVHVGRFNAVKNHEYLVQVFAEIKKRRQDAFLLMVGSGAEEERIRQKLEEMELSDAYTILHNRTDVPELLLASDAAVFPSVVEGLGIALIEIQAAGLPCIASTGVPQSAAISNKIRFLSLDESPEVWAEELLSLCADETPIRYDGIDEWDIRKNVKQLEAIYEKVCEDEREQDR